MKKIVIIAIVLCVLFSSFPLLANDLTVQNVQTSVQPYTSIVYDSMKVGQSMFLSSASLALSTGWSRYVTVTGRSGFWTVKAIYPGKVTINCYNASGTLTSIHYVTITL